MPSEDQRLAEQLRAARLRAKRLDALLNVGTDLSSELDLDLLLAKIMDCVTLVMDAERSSLFILDPDTDELWSKIAQGAQEIRFPVGVGIAGLVARTGETINIPDAYADPRFNPDVDRRTGFRTRSILCMPMRTRMGDIIGVVQVLNKRDGVFTDDDEELLAALASQAAVAWDNAQLYEEQRRAFDAVVTGLNTAMAARDSQAGAHTFRVLAYAQEMAKHYAPVDADSEKFRYAALLHDFGKIGVPDEILTKREPLSEIETEELALHALKTKILLERMHFAAAMGDVPYIASHNHERLDGTGYPDGLRAEAIPPETRLIAVADALDLLTNEFYGEPARTFEEAAAIIAAESGAAYDPEIVSILQKVLPRLPQVRAETEQEAARRALVFE
jgi:HD-GYP domain-containing protein (c-di-GMP phosphodiesterase class II)